MSYLVLARKWRPKRFAELVGQEHVVRALSNALDTGRVHHAFLFTGTRGVGKTTISRIFAKSLNCLQGQGAEPCGTCAVCTDVDAGRFVDLIEIDAASHTGVDDVRDLIDNAQYLPSRGRIKVYLIDEVHMLSKSAFNALLKTLEEPPEHVKFLLATTDPQKLPVTVLSRCLQFNLRRLDIAQIHGQLRKIVDAEGIAAEDAALAQLARGADGSLRDGLSLLDQAIAYSGGELTAAAVHAMLGTLDHAAVAGVLSALAAADGPALLQAIEALAAFSPDYGQVLDDLATALHAAQVQQLVPEAATPVDGLDVAALAGAVAPEVVQLWYQMAITGRRDLPIAPTPRIGFEMALLRMLAFRPMGGAATQPEPSVKVPVVSTAASSGPRKAPPSPFASSTPAMGMPLPAAPVRAPAPPAEAPIVVAASVQVAPAAPLPPPRPSVAPPVVEPVAPDIAAAPPVEPASAGRPLLADAEAWLQVLRTLTISGPVKQLAGNAMFLRDLGECIELALAAEFDHLRGERTLQQLAEAVSTALGAPVTLRFVSAAAATGETLFDRQQREKSTRQQEAEAAFVNDPIVQRLIAQGATVVPGSIKPNEA